MPVIRSAAPPRGPLIEVRNLEFSYVRGRPVVRNVSLNVDRGCLGAVIGSNGCGKSTLIRLLAGILRPHRGQISFDGAPLQSVGPRRLAHKIAYVPQSTSRAFPFTALDVVLTGRSPYLSRFEFETEADLAVAREALESAGIPHLAARPITELSGGERQLVAVARAFAQRPVCFFLDEPSSSLDQKHRAALVRALRDLRDRNSVTALLVTHDLALLDLNFDAVFAMRAGAIVAHGPPSEVLRQSVLMDVYDDAHICTQTAGGRTFVWSEL